MSVLACFVVFVYLGLYFALELNCRIWCQCLRLFLILINYITLDCIDRFKARLCLVLYMECSICSIMFWSIPCSTAAHCTEAQYSHSTRQNCDSSKKLQALTREAVYHLFLFVIIIIMTNIIIITTNAIISNWVRTTVTMQWTFKCKFCFLNFSLSFLCFHLSFVHHHITRHCIFSSSLKSHTVFALVT